MNILFFTHLTTEFTQKIELFRKKFLDHHIICASTKKEYTDALAEAHVLIYGSPNDRELEMAENLELLIVPYAGFSQLNLQLLKEKKIHVSNSHGNATIVAERALALALASTGRVVEFHNDQLKGNWHRTDNHQKPFDYWFSIHRKKIAILGTGAIGQSLAKLLRGFDCHIKGFRRKNSIPENFNSVTTNLEEAISFGDLIFFALPISDETKHLINRNNISLLTGKFVINVGRGSLIEEEPFYEALQKGQIRGAAIDAWYDYPSSDDHFTNGSKLAFSKLPNVVFSPHAASHSEEGKLGQLKGALEVLESYLITGKLLNEVSDQ